MATRWTVPSSQQRTCHEDGQWLVYDDERGASWQVTHDVVKVLESLAEGWQPGAPLPPRLQPFELTDGNAATVVADLVRQGLVVDADAPAVTVRPPSRVPFHFTRSIWRAPVIAPGVWRLIVMALAAAAVAAATIVWSQLAIVPGESRIAFLGRVAREALQSPTAPASAVIETLLYILLLATIHEHAHAFAVSSRTGRRTTVGLRLIFWFWPRPFADVTALVSLPRRRDRISVLLAGPLAEVAAWLVLLAALGPGVSRLGLPFVLLGPATLLSNLIPFVRNDGYLVLQELTGDRDLVHSARRAAHRAFLVPDPATNRGMPLWLPWYGLIELAFAPALLVALGILAGNLVASPSAGAVCGAAAALILLRRRVRGIDVAAEEWPSAHAA
jgi:hypothetical protein